VKNSALESRRVARNLVWKNSDRELRRIVINLVLPIALAIAVALLTSIFGLLGAMIFLAAGSLVGTILYIRVVDWLEYSRIRPDLARPLFPGRRQGGLANRFGGATIGQDKRNAEDRV